MKNFPLVGCLPGFVALLAQLISTTNCLIAFPDNYLKREKLPPLENSEPNELEALKRLVQQNSDEIAKIKQENSLLKCQHEAQEAAIRLLNSYHNNNRAVRSKRNVFGRDPLTELNANVHGLQTDVLGIKLLEDKEFPTIKSEITSHGTQLDRMANLTQQLTSELHKLQTAAKNELENPEISIFYKPTDTQQLHSEFADLRHAFDKIRENQKWSEFLVEIDRIDLQKLKRDLTQIVADLSGSMESIENRTIHEPKRVLVTMLNEEAEEEFSGSGESPEPKIGSWQIQVIEEIRDIRSEQKRLQKLFKKDKMLQKQALKSILDSEVQQIDRSLAKISSRIDAIDVQKLVRSDIDVVLKAVSKLKSDIYDVRADKKTLEHVLTSRIAEISDSIAKIRKDSKIAVFNSNRALTVAEVIKKVQVRHFTAIENFRADLNVMETDVLKFGLKLTTLQADFLNSSLFLNRASEKDQLQDRQITRNSIRLEDSEKQIGLLNSDIKGLTEEIASKIDYRDWKNVEIQLDRISSKIGDLTKETQYFDKLAVVVDKRIENLEYQLPQDCSMSNVKLRPSLFLSGVYIINPIGTNMTTPAFCDMSTSGGNWTLIQRRIDGKTSFNRTWDEYAIGFGSVSSEFWLGNQNLHLLTSNNPENRSYLLRLDTWDIFGDYRFADYENFRIGNRSNFFPLRIGPQIAGNLSDSLAYHANMRFSAPTLDLDASSTHCAKYYGAGWWYSHCHKANLNGNFHVGMVWYDNSTADWIHLKRTEMKIRPIFL